MIKGKHSTQYYQRITNYVSMLLWFLFRQTRNKQIANYVLRKVNYVLRMYRYTITIIIEDWDKLSDLLDTLVPNLLLMLFH